MLQPGYLHLYFSVRLWLDQLVSESRDPQLALSWLPDLSSMKVTAFLHIKLQSNDKDRSVNVTLHRRHALLLPMLVTALRWKF